MIKKMEMNLRLQLEVKTHSEYESLIVCCLYDEKGKIKNHVKKTFNLTGRLLRKEVLRIVKEAIELGGKV
jgi:hypothetical protein